MSNIYDDPNILFASDKLPKVKNLSYNLKDLYIRISTKSINLLWTLKETGISMINS